MKMLKLNNDMIRFEVDVCFTLLPCQHKKKKQKTKLRHQIEFCF